MGGSALTGPTLGILCALGSALSWTLIGLVARALSPDLNGLLSCRLMDPDAGACRSNT